MERKRLLSLKGLTISALAIAMSMSVIAGCGEKEPEEVIPVVSADVISLDKETTEPEEPEEVIEEEPEEVLPDGYVRSSLTNELVTEEVANTRPVAVMIPMDQCAQPDYGNSKAGVVYECLVEGSITRTMNIIEDWEGMDKIGNIRSTRDYFIFWSWEWDAILLHDGGPAAYITDFLRHEYTNNISGLGYRDNTRVAPHNEYYTAEIVNSYIQSYGYQKEHRDHFVPQHFSFVKNGGQADLEEKYDNSIEVYTIDMKNIYPVTKSRFEYNPDDGLYYRYIYDQPHMDNADEANPVQLSFSNVIIQRAIGQSRDDHDYRVYECHKTTEDGWYVTHGRAIHIRWEKTGNETPTRFYDDNGNEIQLSTGKTMICVVQDGGSANLDVIFKDSQGNESSAHFNR